MRVRIPHAALAPVLGIEPALGRWFTEDEERTAARVAVIGEALWQRHWGRSRSVLGASLVLDGSPYTVIGIVPEGFAYSDGVELWMPMRDIDWQGHMGMLVVGRLSEGVQIEMARQEIRALGARLSEIDPGLNANAGLQDSLVEDLSTPLVGLAAAAAAFLLIALANESTVAALLRDRLREVDAAAVLFDVRPMTDVVITSVRRHRFTMLLLSIFAALALAQAAAGVYGLASYDVASRSRELGVRRALGAQRWKLCRMIVGDGLRHATLGLAMGGLTAVLINRWVDAVWDFGAAAPATYVRVAFILLVVVAGAAWPAASRAARIDPVIALREE